MTSLNPSSRPVPDQPDRQPDLRRLVVLGSTGSIGVNTLNVVEHLNRQSAGGFVEIAGLAAGTSIDKLVEQAIAYNVPRVAIADGSLGETLAGMLQRALPDCEVFAGPDAAEQLIEAADATDVTAAVVGSAGLPATVAATRKGCRIGLANKETLVCAGELFTPLVRQHGATLIPVDSEHSAIFQCLNGDAKRNVKRIVLTASGGPFRDSTKADMDNATVEEALAHPTWDMGPKISIDSATMMNKALEIIEAHWLFDLPASKIEVIIHPQSIAHSFVEFEDHSVLCQMGPPDMRTPIQYALTYPDRPTGCSDAMDWTSLRTLEFEPPDAARFPAIGLAYEVIEAGGTAGAIFNAANEQAVAAFLERRIGFGRIVELVAEALSAVATRPVDRLETAIAADAEARAFVNARVGAVAEA